MVGEIVTNIWCLNKRYKALNRSLKIGVPKQMESAARNAGLMQKCVIDMLPYKTWRCLSLLCKITVYHIFPFLFTIFLFVVKLKHIMWFHFNWTGCCWLRFQYKCFNYNENIVQKNPNFVSFYIWHLVTIKPVFCHKEKC